jgi:hypothetical protein
MKMCGQKIKNIRVCEQLLLSTILQEKQTGNTAERYVEEAERENTTKK